MTGSSTRTIQNPVTLTVTLDEEAMAYIEQKKISDVNDCINQLLEAEKMRKGSGTKKDPR